MTVTFDDDPEIVVGGDDLPDPSAPPVAVAVATPIGGNNNNTTTTTSSQQATIPLSTGDGTIERSINQDGSLSVKVTTTITQNDGHREIKTEYFHIPSSMANTVMLSLDAGCPPSSLYRTNMQQRTETTVSNATPIPARAEVINNNSNPTTATTTNTGASSPAYTPRTGVGWGVYRNGCGASQVAGVILSIVVMIILLIVVALNRNKEDSTPNPTPYYPSYPTPYYPSPYSPSSSKVPYCGPWVPTPMCGKPCAPDMSPDIAPVMGK